MPVFNHPTGHKILFVADAWDQINSGTRTLHALCDELIRQNHRVKVFAHEDCINTCKHHGGIVGYPRQADIGKWCRWAHAVHIATPQGPIGIAALWYCHWNNVPYTTSYANERPPMSFFARWYTRFVHRLSYCIFTETTEAKADFESWGHKKVIVLDRTQERCARQFLDNIVY